jgi:hypothetical protein
VQGPVDAPVPTAVEADLAGRGAGPDRDRRGAGKSGDVLFVLPSRSREEQLQENLLDRQSVPVATATVERLRSSGPTGAVWRGLSMDAQAAALIDLVVCRRFSSVVCRLRSWWLGLIGDR